MGYDELQDRLDELMDIQSMLDEASRRLEDLDVMPDDIENEIERCRYELSALVEAEREEMRREYERSVMY